MTVPRFCHERRNPSSLEVADEIAAPCVRFAGSRGASVVGIDAFNGYVAHVRQAVPDFAHPSRTS